MRSRIGTGIVSGLLAGGIFGLLMTFSEVSTPAGEEISIMELVARSFGYTDLWIAWAFHLLSAALIGLVFGAIFGKKVVNYKTGTGFGALFGVLWWAVNGLIFTPLTGGPVTLGVGNLIGYTIFGLALGAFYTAVKHKPSRPVKGPRHREAHA